MKVQDVMTRDVATCAPETDLSTVARVMWDKDCGIVPVVDSSARVLGLLTDRDVCMAAWSQGRALSELRAADAMSKQVAACAPGDEIENALAILRERQVRRLPVTDARGRLVGLLSLNDAARAASAKGELSFQAVASTLAAICQPHCLLPQARKSAVKPAEPLVARQADIEC